MTPERWQEIKRVFDEAVALAGPERVQFLRRLGELDQELCAEVASLITSYDANSRLMETPVIDAGRLDARAEAEPWVGRVLGVYRVVELVGEGGMGAVYRAVRADGLYERPVAVKVIRSALSTEFFLRRFENERRILARLDHPNIARLLDAGASEDNVPYVVMEFVDGVPIDEYCRDEQLSVRERLQLFRAVCAAVQYAHQSLIVHRDLKPANILVTADGEPKLLDFGIAKLRYSQQDADGGQPMTQLPMMTPEFASPEQVRGEAVTTASDVYSLGVVLYLLLTGQRPYRAASHSLQDVIKAVCDSEAAKPSAAVTEFEGVDDRTLRRLRRVLRGELDNIVLMALRKEPQRRYQSVEQFSEDIRRYLENLPIFASRDTLRYRFEKFLARHRSGVAAASMVVVALLVGLVLTWREARIAQHRFDDVRNLGNSLIFDIHDAIQDLPGSTIARKLVVEKALQYLDEMAQESRGDASLQRDVASGYQRVGDAQGNSLAANLGDTAGALKSYRKALALRESIFASHLDSAPDAITLAKALRLVANAALLSSDTASAWKDSQRAARTAEQAARMKPDDVTVLDELREDYATEAAIEGGNYNSSNLANPSGALEVRRQELAVAEHLSALQPGSLPAEQTLARSLAHMGDQLSMVGQRRAALEQYLRAQQMFEKLSSRVPGNKSLEALHGIYTRVYFAQYSQGAKSEALATARRALKVAEALSAADRHDFHARVLLIIDYDNLAVVLSGMDEMAEATKALNESLAAVSDLMAGNAGNGEIPGIQSAVYMTAADIFAKSGDYTRASRYCREVIAIFERLQADDPDDAAAKLDVAAANNQLGKLQAQTHELNAATDSFKKALALSELETTARLPSEEALYSAADSYAGLGDAEERAAALPQPPQNQAAHLDQARTWYTHSLQVWERVKEPGLLSPGGYECVQPSVVRQRLDLLNQALRSTRNSS
jgi:serine/threonine protein kinase